MYACPEKLRRVDLQMVGRSDKYGGHSEIASGTAIVWESEGQDNLDGVYEVSRGIITTIAFLRLKASNINKKVGYVTLIYAKSGMKEWRS